MMASPKIQFSAGDLEDEIKDRAVSDDRSPSLIAQRDLGRYYRVLRASLPCFTIEEARVLVDAVQPHTRRQTAGHTERPGTRDIDPSLMWAYVGRRMEELAEEQASWEDHKRDMTRRGYRPNEEALQRRESQMLGHGVDWDSFMERLRRLTPCEALAIIDAVERVTPTYLNEDDEEEPDALWMFSTYQELTRVGLVSNEDQAFEVLAYWYELDGEWQNVHRVYEHVGEPMRSEKEAAALAERLRAEERSQRPDTRARRYFRVTDLRDDWPEREELHHSPRTLEPLILRTV
jgi:hypothetical protein